MRQEPAMKEWRECSGTQTGSNQSNVLPLPQLILPFFLLLNILYVELVTLMFQTFCEPPKLCLCNSFYSLSKLPDGFNIVNCTFFFVLAKYSPTVYLILYVQPIYTTLKVVSWYMCGNIFHEHKRNKYFINRENFPLNQGHKCCWPLTNTSLQVHNQFGGGGITQLTFREPQPYSHQPAFCQRNCDSEPGLIASGKQTLSPRNSAANHTNSFLAKSFCPETKLAIQKGWKVS